MDYQKQKIRTLKDDPQYFGAFLNMARLNIFNISNYLSRELHLSELQEEGQISNSFLTNKEQKKVNWNKVYSIVRRFMPIVKVFDFESLPNDEQENHTNEGKNYGKQFSEMADSLKIIFRELNEFRNDYSHHFSTETGDERKLLISKDLSDFLSVNYKRAILYTKKRFIGVFNDSDFEWAEKMILFTSGNEITQDGLVFLTSLFLEREYSFQFIGKVKGLKGTQYKSFLATREVMMAFCVNLPHDKFVSDDPLQALTIDIINELNRCPNVLFNVISDKEKEQFRPSINEEKIKNIIENNVIEGGFDYDEYIQNMTKQIRHRNRFSYFALKYIDELKIFDEIRFHIDLGKIVLEEYSKSLAGTDEQRLVVENANAFGRINDFSNDKIVFEKISRQGSDIYFEQYAPHYKMDKNKIGIKFKEDIAIFIKKDSSNKVNGKLRQPLPDAFLSLHELPKIILLEHFNKGASEKIINDFITINNSKLFNKQFIEGIRNYFIGEEAFNKRSRGRKRIAAYNEDWEKELNARKEKLNEVLKPHNLNDKQIPERILNYWLNIKDVNKKHAISDRIKLIKRDCMDRLKAVKKDNPPKVGEMATFLAKDIVDMIIDSDKKKKITSFYYDKIQECLALYNVAEKRQLFLDICSEKELDLFNTDKGHPFIKSINPAQIRYTSDFYVKYLQEKGHKLILEKNRKTGKTKEVDKSWLFLNFYNSEWSEKNNKNVTVVKFPDVKSKIPFSILQLEKQQSTFEEWYNNITKGKKKTDNKKPIDLPTNIFDFELKNILLEKLESFHVEYKKDSYYNILFKLWWHHCRKDSVQEFYNAEREYIIYEESVRFNINTSSNFSDYYKDALSNAFLRLSSKRNEEMKHSRKLQKFDLKQVENVFSATIGNTEKEIRILQEEDRLMLLMLERLLGDGNKNIELKKVNVLLNETTTIMQEVPGMLSFDQDGKIVKDKNQRLEIKKTITDTRKRKDFSVLRKFVFDRRLPELFEYFDGNEMPHEKLKLELDSYNKSKELVFDSVFKLEKVIIERDKTGISTLFKDENGNIKSGNIQHKPYLDWLLIKKYIDEGEYKFMNMVRNSFSHNQFPQKKTMELFIANWNDSKFSEQIIEVYNQKINNIIQNME